MENMNTLNTTGGWEEIVNQNAMQRASARERVAAWKRERRLRKLLKVACMTTLACIASVILGELGLVPGWLSSIGTFVSLTLTAFTFGLYVEAEKR